MLQPPLSPQEHEVLRQIADGNTTKTIADNLGIEPRTVDCHRLSIRRKACLLNRSKTTLFQFARKYFGKSGDGGGG